MGKEPIKEDIERVVAAASLATKVATDAATTARDVIARAEKVASDLISNAGAGQESLKVLTNDMSYLRRDVAEIKETLKNDFITRIEFEAKFYPVQKITYGLVAVLGIATITAVLKLVLKL